jgi:hypothetical protein
MFDSPLVLQPQFYKAKIKILLMSSAQSPTRFLLIVTLPNLRLANKVQGLVFSKTVNKISLMIKERFKKD